MPKPPVLTDEMREAILELIKFQGAPALHDHAHAAVDRVLLEKARSVAAMPGHASLGNVGFAHELRQAGARVPLSVDWQSMAGGYTRRVEVAPKHGQFYIEGVRSFNDPLEITVTLVTGGSGNNYLPGPVDSAAYSVVAEDAARARAGNHLHPATLPADGFHKADWGMCSKECPLVIEFRTWETPTCLPHLLWTLYGQYRNHVSPYAVPDCAPPSVPSPEPTPELGPCLGCGKPRPFVSSEASGMYSCADCPAPTVG